MVGGNVEQGQEQFLQKFNSYTNTELRAVMLESRLHEGMVQEGMQKFNSIEHFEGTERTLNVEFDMTGHGGILDSSAGVTCGTPVNLRSLLNLTDWCRLLESAQVEVLSFIKDDHWDAYLLSESSLFVHKSGFILKTCGITTPLKILGEVLEMVGKRLEKRLEKRIEKKDREEYEEMSSKSNIYSHLVIHLTFRHQGYLHPEEQQFPHRNPEEEMEYIRPYVEHLDFQIKRNDFQKDSTINNSTIINNPSNKLTKNPINKLFFVEAKKHYDFDKKEPSSGEGKSLSSLNAKGERKSLSSLYAKGERKSLVSDLKSDNKNNYRPDQSLDRFDNSVNGIISSHVMSPENRTPNSSIMSGTTNTPEGSPTKPDSHTSSPIAHPRQIYKHIGAFQNAEQAEQSPSVMSDHGSQDLGNLSDHDSPIEESNKYEYKYDHGSNCSIRSDRVISQEFSSIENVSVFEVQDNISIVNQGSSIRDSVNQGSTRHLMSSVNGTQGSNGSSILMGEDRDELVEKTFEVNQQIVLPNEIETSNRLTQVKKSFSHSFYLFELTCTELDPQNALEMFTSLHPESSVPDEDILKRRIQRVREFFTRFGYSIVDDWFYDGVGYSANGLNNESHYITIHITPQRVCSYASVETNDRRFQKECERKDLIEATKELMMPGNMMLLEVDENNIKYDKVEANNEEITKMNSSTQENNEYHSTHHDSCSTLLPIPASTFKKNVHKPVNRNYSPNFDKLCNKLPSDQVTIQEVSDRAIDTIGGDIAIAMVDMHVLKKKWDLWHRTFNGKIHPFYATKCNPDPLILEYLGSMGANFDCASKQEIDLILNLGYSPDRIIFANPCKFRSDMEFAKKKGVYKVTWDNLLELEKIKQVYGNDNDFNNNVELILRIHVDDKNAQCPMSLKFGAQEKDWEILLDKIIDLDMAKNFRGVSFHVGSGCTQEGSFKQALTDAARIFAMVGLLDRYRNPDNGSSIFPNVDLLDIGGGFVNSSSPFEKMAKEINDTLNSNPILRRFLESDKTRVIAEPGRFFAEECTHLLTKCYAVNSNNKEKIRYYLSDGLYGSFNNIIYDHAELHKPILIKRKSQRKSQNSIEKNVAESSVVERKKSEESAVVEVKESLLFGPTCDGFDCVSNKFVGDMKEGDYLLFSNMGAYTQSVATRFNGMPLPKKFYYSSASLHQ